LEENAVPKVQLVGGFNPFEKYWSKWESSPDRDENKGYLKPPPRESSIFGESEFQVFVKEKLCKPIALRSRLHIIGLLAQNQSLTLPETNSLPMKITILSWVNTFKMVDFFQPAMSVYRSIHPLNIR